jgi:hypothetical protein
MGFAAAVQRAQVLCSCKIFVSMNDVAQFSKGPTHAMVLRLLELKAPP